MTGLGEPWSKQTLYSLGVLAGLWREDGSPPSAHAARLPAHGPGRCRMCGTRHRTLCAGTPGPAGAGRRQAGSSDTASHPPPSLPAPRPPLLSTPAETGAPSRHRRTAAPLLFPWNPGPGRTGSSRSQRPGMEGGGRARRSTTPSYLQKKRRKWLKIKAQGAALYRSFFKVKQLPQ